MADDKNQSTDPLKNVLSRLRQIREKSGVSQRQLEEKLILGPGWVSRIESGLTVPTLAQTFAILHSLGANFEDLVRDLPKSTGVIELTRQVFAEQRGKDLVIHFEYADHDASYRLPGATLAEFEQVLKTLRDGLARLENDNAVGEAIKTDAVASTFLKAASLWPYANPSDLWWFLVYRTYCDPFNHPARFARLDFTQSWKRTGGWALEEVLVRHYGPHLLKHGVRLFIATADEKTRYIDTLNVSDRLEADKVDVLLVGLDGKLDRCFGVVHVKASFAERRTDDVPMSQSLLRSGYTSPLWTMDCKSSPSKSPVNRGELGGVDDGQRSAKRKDIEDDGFFSACFSYNTATVPTPNNHKHKALIHVCDFKNPDDAFSQFILSQWKQFLKNSRLKK